MLTLHEFYTRYERGGRRRLPSLWHAFLRGFGAMSALARPAEDDLPRYPRDALYTDLVRIGDDMRTAMGIVDREIEADESRAP